MSSEQLVLEAVKQKNSSKTQSVLQKLFALWFDAFVYNQIWEDPRVDLQALRLNEDSRVLTISSGGCNALNYLIDNPESVTAVDLNRHHIFLLNLKISALRFLPTYEDFFNFFGFGKHSNNVENYKKFIAPNLDESTKKFWEGNGFFGNLFNGNRVNYFANDGLYQHSRNGYFLRFFHTFARFLGCRTDEILKANSLEEQEKIYQKHIAPFFDSFVIKVIGKMPVTMFGLGIPPQQYDELRRDLAEGGSVIDVYRERAKRLACDYPINENYFAWQAFGRKYDTENRRAVPEYLKEENYETLKANANRLQTKIGSITEEIKQNPIKTFNRFVFLDAQDWMNAETMTELWQAIWEKAENGSRIIFRTAGAISPIETNLPTDLQSKFDCQKEFSQELFKQDRASIYGGFYLYTLK
ncbi:MAG: BtaA family protein [Acidobacteria bacterium]|jgi:S-adenosylmethionine-diacylglycerol 3-amino-3-carboxypropyl transferase|nr:BtaA family protein [Acidobacteriota bacterium]MBA4123927.1 BtaA family protein [Acidobacteriota bacterium]